MIISRSFDFKIYEECIGVPRVQCISELNSCCRKYSCLVIMVTIENSWGTANVIAVVVAVSLDIEIVLAVFAIVREAIFVGDILNDLDVKSAVYEVRLAPRPTER